MQPQGQVVLCGVMTGADFILYSRSAGIILIVAHKKIIYSSRKGYLHNRDCGSYNHPRYDLLWKS